MRNPQPERRVLAVALGAGVALLAAGARAQAPGGLPTGQSVVVVHQPAAQHPVRGNPNAPLNILYFVPWKSDPTKLVQPQLQQLLKQFAGRVRLQFMNKPREGAYYLSELYAAKVGRELFVQGGDRRFWKFHDALMQLPSMYSLSEQDVDRAARAAGADLGRVQRALAAGRHDAAVAAESALGARLSLAPYQSAPVLLVGTSLHYLSQWSAYANLEAVVRLELQKATGHQASGLSPSQVHEKLLAEAKTRYQPYRPYTGYTPPAMRQGVVKRHPIPVGQSPLKGNAAAWVTVVAFIDFTDYNSSYAWNTLESALSLYAKRLCVVYKMFPRPQNLPGLLAAKAAYAAHRQGKYEEMAKVLMQNRWRISEQALPQLVTQAGLNVAQFARDLRSPETAQRVLDDAKVARVAGVFQPPAVFVNGRRLLSTYWNAQEFDQVLKAELRGGLLHRVLGP